MNALSDNRLSLSDYIDILRRRRIYLLTVLPATVFVAACLAFLLPPSYRSSATILIEESSIPTDMVQTTVADFADQQIELVQRRVMEPGRLQKLVEAYDPYPDEPELSVADKAQRVLADTSIERVDPVTFEIRVASNAFTLHYDNPDPQRAAQVAQRISDLFLGYNREMRSEQALQTYNFLLQQSNEVEKKIEEIERRIATFKSRYSDSLPEIQTRNLALVERVDRDVQSVEGQIRIAEEKESLLRIQLSRMNPTLGSTAGNWRTELATLQAQLAEARIKYTPDHPDVKRLQRQIDALAAKASQEGDTGPAVVPDNPDYLAVQSQLQSVERELSALRATAARGRSQIAQYESRLSSAPVVERDYAELTRTRDGLLAQHADLQGKLASANVARNLETEQMGTRYTQIRAPRVPTSPYSPNRVGLILLGIVLGAALGAGLAALAESLDTTVRGARDMRELTTVPVLGAIPVVYNSRDYRKFRMKRAAYAGVLMIACAFVGIVAVTAG